mgnify:CR=1 FL=1
MKVHKGGFFSEQIKNDREFARTKAYIATEPIVCILFPPCVKCVDIYPLCIEGIEVQSFDRFLSSLQFSDPKLLESEDSFVF